ncbi:hypothetical protein Zm00014a_016526 [Zea mays]|uniref:Secreted protein n=1 Tax=Zea mays TaxID=4577 RepID=A0A3L6DUR7_MAIZE|nr:hypothetical protein Zm00014a_016526 [Zea mays]
MPCSSSHSPPASTTLLCHSPVLLAQLATALCCSPVFDVPLAEARLERSPISQDPPCYRQASRLVPCSRRPPSVDLLLSTVKFVIAEIACVRNSRV